MNSSVFALLLRKADQFGIWKYAGLPVWAVPYIMLTFTDFVVRRPAKPAYVIRFIIDKPARSKLNTTWLHPGQCSLAKYFVNGGKATKLFGAGKSQVRPTSTAASTFPAIPNPLPFSEPEFLRLTADTSWISSGLKNLLAEMAMVASVEGACPADGTATLAVAPTREIARQKQEGEHISKQRGPASSVAELKQHAPVGDYLVRDVTAVPTAERGLAAPAASQRVVVERKVPVGYQLETSASQPLDTSTASAHPMKQVADAAPRLSSNRDSHDGRIPAPSVGGIRHGDARPSSSRKGPSRNVKYETVEPNRVRGLWAWLKRLLC